VPPWSACARGGAERSRADSQVFRPILPPDLQSGSVCAPPEALRPQRAERRIKGLPHSHLEALFQAHRQIVIPSILANAVALEGWVQPPVLEDEVCSAIPSLRE